MDFYRRLNDSDIVDINHITNDEITKKITLAASGATAIDITDARFIELIINTEIPYFNPDRVVNLTIGLETFPIGPVFSMMLNGVTTTTSWGITNPDATNECKLICRIFK